MAIVYLLHLPDQRTHGHYLGVAESEAAIPPTMRFGHGQRAVPAHVLADVWETADLAAAQELLRKFQRQGSHKRHCSICSPGNARGEGTGRWSRAGRTIVRSTTKVQSST